MRHHHVGGRDQVFGAEVEGTVFHQTAPRAQSWYWPNSCLMVAELVADDGGDALGLGQDVQQVVDLGHHFLVFGNDLVLLQAGQALQAHLQNFLRLRVRQAVQAVCAHAVVAGPDRRGGSRRH
jgi:hypothetical protein